MQIDTFEYVIKKWEIDLKQPSPIYINRSRDWSFPRLLKDLDFNVGAEIGVADGIFSEQMFIKHPKLKLYEVDYWEEYPEYKDYHHNDLFIKYDAARKRLKPYNSHFVRDLSMNAVKRFADESLDFVYIDAAHDYDHVIEDVREWEKKVKKGGIVAGHDYGKRKNYGVVQAMNDWITQNRIHPLIILNKNTVKSWMYIKR